MRLPEKAERYYKQLLGIKVSEIEEVCQPELRYARECMPHSGARGKAIANGILKRWRMMAEARMNCWLAASRKFNIKVEKPDALEFAREKFDGSRQGILNSFVTDAGGAASNHFVNQLEQINRETRAKLLVEVTNLELERKQAKKNKKEEKAMRKKRQGDTTINVKGDAIHSSFQTGDKSKTKLGSLVNIQLNQTLHQIRDEVENSTELQERDKAKALRQIDKLIVSTNKEPTPGRLQKIKKRVDTFISLASSTTQLIGTVTPLIEKVKEYWHNIKW
jgi:hypothetical protein